MEVIEVTGSGGSTQTGCFEVNLADSLPNGHHVRGIDPYLYLGKKREQISSFTVPQYQRPPCESVSELSCKRDGPQLMEKRCLN